MAIKKTGAAMRPDPFVQDGAGILAIIDGTSGDDNLFDTAGNDTINAFAGNDTITVTDGSDQINGDVGTDTLVIDYSGETDSGAFAVVTQAGPSVNGTLGGFDGQYFVNGSGSDDNFATYSSIERFIITTHIGAFNDIVTTATGDDVVSTDAGDDLVDVGAGINTANGGAGVDRLSADFSGQAAGVSINFNNGTNSGAYGSFSNFEYFGTITGSAFNDSFISVVGIDTQTFNLGNGNDLAKVVDGNNAVINGGAGTDTLVIDYSGETDSGAFAVVTQAGPSANGTLGGFDGQYFVNGSGSDDNFASYTSIENFDITTHIGVFADVITTATGNDTVNTNAGDDLVSVGAGINTANGGAGVDRLSADFSGQAVGVSINLNNTTNSGAYGSFSNFEYFGTITGSSFNDSFISSVGIGTQTFNLGNGNDLAKVVDGDNAVINGGAGTDTLVIDYSGETDSGAFAVTTTSGPSANGTLGGFDGQYFVNGSGSDDNFATYSSIEIFNITTHIGVFNDIITTATGDDVVSTDAGDDLVDVGAGTNTANGGAGTDRLSADFSAQAAGVSIDLNNAVNSGVFGAYSNFEYFGTVTGTGSDDSFISVAGIGTQTFNLGGGDDLAAVVDGNNAVINGGAGIDTLVIDYSADAGGPVTTTSGPSANGTLGGFDGQYFLNGPGSDDNFATYSSIERFDISTGIGAWNDVVTTATGDDRVKVFVGDDTVNLGTGLDTLVLDYTTAAAALVTLSGPTINGVLGGFDGKYSTSATNEVAYTSADRFEITGTAFNDTIVTATGNDIIDGGAGADGMTGGAGDDIYFVDNAGDTVTEGAGGGTDEIRTTRATFSLAALPEIENLTGLSASGQTLTGNGSANVITGSTGNDTLQGQGGADTLVGGDGNDSLVGGNGDDSLTGGKGADTLRGEAGNDIMTGGVGNDRYFVDDAGDVVNESSGSGTDEIRTSLATFSLSSIAEVENLTGLSATGQTLTGNTLGNRITGGAGDDTINGGGGGDELNGGGGFDKINGGGGGDRLVMTDGGDRFTGGGGGDRFLLTDNFTAVDRVRITDFSGNDLFEVGAADFGGGLTPGALPASAFVANATGTAQDASDRFVYNTATGDLFYDADGTGAGASLLIANLTGAPVINAADFIVV